MCHGPKGRSFIIFSRNGYMGTVNHGEWTVQKLYPQNVNETKRLGGPLPKHPKSGPSEGICPHFFKVDTTFRMPKMKWFSPQKTGFGRKNCGKKVIFEKKDLLWKNGIAFGNSFSKLEDPGQFLVSRFRIYFLWEGSTIFCQGGSVRKKWYPHLFHFFHLAVCVFSSFTPVIPSNIPLQMCCLF